MTRPSQSRPLTTLLLRSGSPSRCPSKPLSRTTTAAPLLGGTLWRHMLGSPSIPLAPTAVTTAPPQSLSPPRPALTRTGRLAHVKTTWTVVPPLSTPAGSAQVPSAATAGPAPASAAFGFPRQLCPRSFRSGTSRGGGWAGIPTGSAALSARQMRLTGTWMSGRTRRRGRTPCLLARGPKLSLVVLPARMWVWCGFDSLDVCPWASRPLGFGSVTDWFPVVGLGP